MIIDNGNNLMVSPRLDDFTRNNAYKMFEKYRFNKNS